MISEALIEEREKERRKLNLTVGDLPESTSHVPEDRQRDDEAKLMEAFHSIGADVVPESVKRFGKVNPDKPIIERIWRTSKLVVHRLIYKEYCIQLNVAITYAKTSFYHNAIIDCNGDQRKLFKLVNSLLGRSKQVVLPPHDDPASLSATFNHYFMTKIDAIRDEFPGLIARLPDYFCPPIDTILEPINVKFL